MVELFIQTDFFVQSVGKGGTKFREYIAGETEQGELAKSVNRLLSAAF